MTDNEHFRKILVTRREELTSMIEKIEDRLDDPKPQDIEDRATEREDDEVLELQANAEYRELKSIDSALERIRNNVYGICLSCHATISTERLNAVPYAMHCRNCMESNS